MTEFYQLSLKMIFVGDFDYSIESKRSKAIVYFCGVPIKFWESIQNILELESLLVHQLWCMMQTFIVFVTCLYRLSRLGWSGHYDHVHGCKKEGLGWVIFISLLIQRVVSLLQPLYQVIILIEIAKPWSWGLNRNHYSSTIVVMPQSWSQ